jgi:PAS domain S-box-containing protein
MSSPGVDGLDLTRRLRADERTAALPIMILSQRAGEDARIKGYQAGADEYMEKPFAARELIARIENVVALAGARANIAGKLRRVAVLVRLASVVETAMDAVISIDKSQRITLFNAAAEKMFGCDALSAMGRPLDDFIPQRFRAAHARHVEGFSKTGVSGRTMGRLGDLTALRADGVEFPIEASISQARIDGEVLFTVILRDMSERHAAAETQRLLIGELDHRVKNTLAIVQAIANQTAKAHVDPKMFAESFNGRVRAMASAHTLLTQAGWKGADLGSLLREQLTLGMDPRIVLVGPPVSLGPQFALHFGMVLYELGSNARKYGALSRDEGRLDLRWKVETIENASYLAFEWTESGGPPTETPPAKHFGTRLIESSLTHALHGKVELDFAPMGLCCRILLPLQPGIA